SLYPFRIISALRNEIFEKCSILFKFKEGENFNHRNTYSILRIKLKLHCVQNVEPDTEIGQKGAFCKGLETTMPKSIQLIRFLSGSLFECIRER
ncbi:MAG: hypothetical protein V3S72_05125, partial [Desulfobacterales bacterium]